MKREVLSVYLLQICAWIFAFNLFGIPTAFILLDFKEHIDPTIQFNFAFGILINIVCGLLTGLALGTIDLWLERKNAAKISFHKLFFIKSLYYISVFILLVIFTGLGLRVLNTGGNWVLAWNQFLTQDSFNTMTAYLIFSCLYSFIVSVLSQVRRNYGRGTLIPLFLGRYYEPKEEKRIFMFLDLKSSTTIAEQIGHLKFSHLIQDCFYDLNRLVNSYKASIYQYVGDEAVLTWTLPDGISNCNCLALFFDFKKLLSARQDYYESTFGVVPEFKCGLNAGLVTITEIGVVKKELAYHGDVLNTAARIQSKCNELKSDCLISNELKELIEKELDDFTPTFIKEIQLKGKEKKVGIYSIQINKS